ncbi:MAG: hypothetical protein ABI165_11600 [Bryobacteraceae bacterium]
MQIGTQFRSSRIFRRELSGRREVSERTLMKLSTYLGACLTAGTFLLAGTLALAQTSSAARGAHPRDAASGQSSGRMAQPSQASGIAIDHAGGNGVARMAGTHNSSSNPQAAQNNNSGENPLYEPKNNANLKPKAGGSDVVEYKDPEDMTTRYRPGNNKSAANPIAVDHAGGNGVQRMDGGHAASGRDAESAMGSGASAAAQKKKHLAGVKYEDRTSGGGNQMQTPHTAARGSRH